METLVAALQEVENIPAYLPNCLQLQDVLDKAKDWLQEAEALQVMRIPARPARCVCVVFLICQSRNVCASSSGGGFLCWTTSLSWFSERRPSR